jgi:hypothetical protein
LSKKPLFIKEKNLYKHMDVEKVEEDQTQKIVDASVFFTKIKNNKAVHVVDYEYPLDTRYKVYDL